MTFVKERIKQCDVVYHQLGETDRSAMPIGNGVLASSVWTQKDGNVYLYLSRVDALTEIDRTVKLGMIKISCNPIQFSESSYRQELSIYDGVIEIIGKNGALTIWIDSEKNCLCVKGDFSTRVGVNAEYITWRTEDKGHVGEYLGSLSSVETADCVIDTPKGVLFYHKNGDNLIAQTFEIQNISEYLDIAPDFLTNRIFGGLVVESKNDFEYELIVATESMQGTKEVFESSLQNKICKLGDLKNSLEKTKLSWNEYWHMSYIFVEGDEAARIEPMDHIKKVKKETSEYTCTCESEITKAYTYTKYMNACCNKGEFPVLYNGMLFNLCPGNNMHFARENFGEAYTVQPANYTIEVNPDERSWCREHLWQNVRHPYFSMLMRGEGEKMKALFRYYKNFAEINRARADKYFHAKGQHTTEMTMSFGVHSAEIYGLDRTGVADGYVENRWGGAVDISPGLELVALMLEYYEFMKDVVFLNEEVLPLLKDILLYIETRFPKMKDGKMQIGPINAIETYRDTINPVTIIAGLQCILGKLCSWNADEVENHGYFCDYYKKVPGLKVDEKTQLISAADEYIDERFNVEVPELYAIYPFKNYAFYKEDANLAVRTFKEKIKQYDTNKCFIIGETPGSPSYSGWQYNGVIASILNLKDEAGEMLRMNCGLQNPGTRFPAMWGPIYDAVPDTDHGANILNQLQYMVMQVEGEKIYILPGFPEAWNVEFKLYADKDTVIEVSYKDGVIQDLNVIPESRKKDIIICG